MYSNVMVVTFSPSSQGSVPHRRRVSLLMMLLLLKYT